MAWLQLALVAYREQAALIEAALENGGALAVTIDDAADDPDAGTDLGAGAERDTAVAPGAHHRAVQ